MSMDPPERVTGMLVHLHQTYAIKLNVPDNIHVISGLLTPTVSVPFAMGVSTPECMVEQSTYAAYVIGADGPLGKIGAEDANGIWAMYISAPNGIYDEASVGRSVEMIMFGEHAEALRWSCLFPADYPETNASLEQVAGSFPWEQL